MNVWRNFLFLFNNQKYWTWRKWFCTKRPESSPLGIWEMVNPIPLSLYIAFGCGLASAIFPSCSIHNPPAAVPHWQAHSWDGKEHNPWRCMTFCCFRCCCSCFNTRYIDHRFSCNPSCKQALHKWISGHITVSEGNDPNGSKDWLNQFTTLIKRYQPGSD